MSDILIKGMEMPKSGTYEVSIDNTNGKDKTIMSMFVRGSGGLICCGVYEIVPVPKHGDLIDRDALIKDGWLNLHKEVIRMGGYAIHELPLKNPSIPVIIPTEEGE